MHSVTDAVRVHSKMQCVTRNSKKKCQGGGDFKSHDHQLLAVSLNLLWKNDTSPL